MNFSSFGSAFSGINHKFENFSSHNSNLNYHQDNSVSSNRFQPQNSFISTPATSIPSSSASSATIHYGQNMYTQQHNDYLNVPEKSLVSKNHTKIERDDALNHSSLLQNVNQSWPTSNTVDYSSHLLSATLPISIQHILKYSETIKKEIPSTTSSSHNNGMTNTMINSQDANNFNLKNDLLGLKGSVGSNLNIALGNLNSLNHHNHHSFMNENDNNLIGNGVNGINNVNLNIPSHNTINHNNILMNQSQMNGSMSIQKNSSSLHSSIPAKPIKKERKKTVKQPNPVKKPKRVKAPKEKKQRPKPGEIREKEALDGSKLYLCPECQMAYPERELVEQHVLQHAVERKFVCDICMAALKRKDHLTRHKLSHIPDRPHSCNICMKTFKRKEQLTLHYVIHSGEKKHICQECNKGFYRKDHLRKHTRSHIARRVKSEMSGQTQPLLNNLNLNNITTTINDIVNNHAVPQNSS